MSEKIYEQIAKIFDVDVDEMDIPTFVAYTVHQHWLKVHWEQIFKPALLKMVEELDKQILGEHDERS